jgi:hypothetical protein
MTYMLATSVQLLHVLLDHACTYDIMPANEYLIIVHSMHDINSWYNLHAQIFYKSFNKRYETITQATVAFLSKSDILSNLTCNCQFCKNLTCNCQQSDFCNFVKTWHVTVSFAKHVTVSFCETCNRQFVTTWRVFQHGIVTHKLQQQTWHGVPTTLLSSH